MISQIWTVGHSTRTIDEFVAALESHGIKLLVDVRSLPGSKRYPQFNKEALSASLHKAGIRYEHFLELGGRRKAPSNSRNIAWRNASFRGYADYMETEEFQKGIERLVDLAKEVGSTAIMCAEAVWWHPRQPTPSNRESICSLYSRPHDAVIRVYDEAGNVIEIHKHGGAFKEW